jgi:hypothetical protein
VEDNGDGTYEANCPTIVEQGVYQLRLWHCLRGIWGEYFYDGFFDRLAVQRLDHSVDFTWGVGKLIPRGKDYISIRWTGAILSNLTGPMDPIPDTVIYFDIALSDSMIDDDNNDDDDDDNDVNDYDDDDYDNDDDDYDN